MRIEVIRSEGLAAQSYYVQSKDEAIVIDPRRDAEVYSELSKSSGSSIRYIFETHRNEDYVTGSLELQNLEPSAEICHSKATAFKFGEHLLDDYEALKAGEITITCINTPGHTDDSMCYAISESSDGSNPMVVFTGDTLFVNEVGRTDLVDIRKHAEMSRKLYNSLHQKLLPLGDKVAVYPAHGAGSVCGGDIGDEESTTIGKEKDNNRWLSLDEESFVEEKTSQRLTLAGYFKHCEHLNTIGPPLLSEFRERKMLQPSDLEELLEDDKHRAIDTRDPESYLSRHIKNSISLPLTNMGLLAGWTLRPSQTFSFILGEAAESQNERLRKAGAYLHRIGFDNIIGFLEGGTASWKKSGRELTSFASLSIDELANQLDNPEFVLVDVREPHEYQAEHIKGSLSFPLTGLEEADTTQLKGKDVATICPSGNRSMAGASLLARKNVRSISVPLGGLKKWKAKGHEVQWSV